MAKLKCAKCSKTCKGHVLKVDDKYYHKLCFECIECSAPLKEINFCVREGFLYCQNHFNQKYGTRCHKCGQYMSGEVITAEGKFYHPDCFLCYTCGVKMAPGNEILDTGNGISCDLCASRLKLPSPIKSVSRDVETRHMGDHGLDARPIINGDLGSNGHPTPDHVTINGNLVTLMNESPYSQVPCSQSKKTNNLSGDSINNKLISADGTIIGPLDSLKCESCHEIIKGQLLQAGDKFFHPECGRCIICDQPFKEAEDVYLLGTDIWHSYCAFPKDNTYSFDASHSANTSFFSRGSTPYSSLDRSRNPYGGGLCYYPHQSNSVYEYDTNNEWGVAQIYTISYLYPGNDQGYLRTTLPIKVPKSPHFHRPPGRFTYHRDKGRFMIPAKKKGMIAMVENMEDTVSFSRRSSPSSCSQHPSYKNILPLDSSHPVITSVSGQDPQEPIELAHYPAAKKPDLEEISHPKIEREDWPGPPYGPAIPERKYLWIRPEDMFIEEKEAIEVEKAKIKKETKYLEKLESGLGKVFLKDLEEKERRIPSMLPKLIDPRNASRTPSARKEPRIPTRYGSPIWASPSRYVTYPSKFKRPDDTYLYYPDKDYCKNIEVLSKSSTLPGISAEELTAEEIQYYMNENHRAKSAELANISQQELQNDIEGPDQKYIYRGPMINEMYRMFPHTAHHRRSMPNMSESVKVYPYHLLKTTNRKLPKDVDRTFLERHLALDEFKYLFGCTPIEFYKLPEWRRNLMKKAAKLW
ncbi:actin-binding LIM protein 1-like isoform X2 [Gordionus sp. m RMFG-2023]|uniref:actin-binding LIM protein 1-like isoform X2 n=1 Tax=Gordionus sp. m RMFG-2023 TaxID=3053472 RepID=UPI0031FC6EC0